MGAILDCPSFNPSICHNSVSAQYLENKLKDFLPNFVYALILIRYRLGLLHIIFHAFVI